MVLSFKFHLSGAVCSCLLPESLQLPAIKQPLEYHLGSGWLSKSFVFVFVFFPHSTIRLLNKSFVEDGSESPSIISAQESDDTDQDRLLSPPKTGGDVAFIQEVRR